MSSTICDHLDVSPEIDPSAFIAPDARVIGDVKLGPHSSIWYGCIVRADIERIRIGEGSNIQDGTVIHLSSNLRTEIGRYTSCGHRAILHACRIGDGVLVGMGAIVMDGAEIGDESIIGAGSLVTQGLIVPPGSLVFGSPAKVIRTLDNDEKGTGRRIAEKYVKVAREHACFLGRNADPA